MSDENETIVSLLNIEKWYGNNHVVKNMNMNIKKGEFLTLLGPSGCGKTTTLRMISGFEHPTSGIVKINNENVADKEPYDREVNTVFQNYALFPHMDVYNNIAYGLKLKKVPKDEIDKKVREMLQMVQLEGFEKRHIDKMSGGQKQRIAIARAIINSPKVLLLDEPLGALDMKLRKQMQIELKRLQKKLGITFVFVTHDQEEALTMSDRIAVISNGVVDQLDTPENIYKKPKTRFVANFIGESNIFDAVITNIGDIAKFGTEVGSGLTDGKGFAKDEAVSVSVRPEDTMFSETPVKGFTIKGMVKDYLYIGNMMKMIVRLKNGEEIKINRTHFDTLPEAGSEIYIYWDTKRSVTIKSVEDKELEQLKKIKIA